MYITSPLKIMEEIVISFPELFVKKMLEPWMNANIQIVAQLSKANVWKQHNPQMEQMYNGREELINITSYVDFEKLCYVINNFPELNHNFVK